MCECGWSQKTTSGVILGNINHLFGDNLLIGQVLTNKPRLLNSMATLFVCLALELQAATMPGIFP